MTDTKDDEAQSKLCAYIKPVLAPVPEVVGCLKQLLVQAKAGEVRALFVVVEQEEEEYSTVKAGRYTPMRVLGMLSRLAHRIHRDLDGLL